NDPRGAVHLIAERMDVEVALAEEGNKPLRGRFDRRSGFARERRAVLAGCRKVAFQLVVDVAQFTGDRGHVSETGQALGRLEGTRVRVQIECGCDHAQRKVGFVERLRHRRRALRSPSLGLGAAKERGERRVREQSACWGGPQTAPSGAVPRDVENADDFFRGAPANRRSGGAMPIGVIWKTAALGQVKQVLAVRKRRHRSIESERFLPWFISSKNREPPRRPLLQPSWRIVGDDGGALVFHEPIGSLLAQQRDVELLVLPDDRLVFLAGCPNALFPFGTKGPGIGNAVCVLTILRPDNVT